MANPEHVDIVKQGSAAINEWRLSHPNEALDLIEADLSFIVSLANAKLNGADFSGADLGNADLSGANLVRAKFSGTDLNGADLSGADLDCAHLNDAKLMYANLSTAKLNGANLSTAKLNGANLNGADLTVVNLGYADLSGANLNDTNLFGANFNGTILSGTDLTGSILALTIFGGVDLSGVQGLEKVKHQGPSSIGIDTIYRSNGQIPEVFLRGCGVPENFIIYMGSLVGTAIEFYSCFISYSSENQAFAKRLHADLQENGVRCWYAPEDMKIGDKIRQTITDAVRIHDKLLLVCSEKSVMSDWVEKEVETAFKKERDTEETVLFPIKLDDAITKTNKAWAEDIYNTRHIGDFTNWEEHDSYKKGFDRLLSDLKL